MVRRHPPAARERVDGDEPNLVVQIVFVDVALWKDSFRNWPVASM